MRFTPREHAELRVAAKLDNRKLTNFAETVLLAHLDKVRMSTDPDQWERMVNEALTKAETTGKDA